ncbi:hypothetical protein ASPACDRAFT_79228 [Aspergillus aculeatus ATCC 16872]|uniref:tRNA (guanine(9)-N1)-methyltransferase n=1 Tax=Aspergillus aculeatus (strain ATCC 16872 / CBS 172.66 / WB 5094) TaxID=690307 RepID=A0A1L9WT57_ASPA1|nr:uncharacterized protein ASPACDRAFT_79228 [Aspergillus aculeatus ATCC 16872]OJJ99312.1 hypothetical protein ASPACDRAFT_79228 [Aspergillus aculeatus ATCC 16872]
MEEGRPRKLVKLDHDDSQQPTPPQQDTTMAESSPVPEPSTAPVETRDNDDNTTTATTTTNNGAPSDPTDETAPMSKRAMKRQRRREQWEEGREQRKVKRKERIQARKERRRAELQVAKDEGREAEFRKEHERTPARFRKGTLLPLTLILDCSFDELMIEKERISLGSQLTRSYSDNSRAPFRSHLVVSSFNKLLKQRFDTVLAKTYENWKGIRFLEEDFVEAAEKAKEWMVVPDGGRFEGVFADKADTKPEDGEVVYLSSDSPHTLTELKPFSTYIIGGLVDKNRHKGICYKQAVERGIKTAKLPIGEYIQMASRQVLATNHVVEIMLKWLEVGDWGKAFMEVIPQRKGGTLKESVSESGEPQDGEDEAEEEEEGEGEEDAKEEAEAIQEANAVAQEQEQEEQNEAVEAKEGN